MTTPASGRREESGRLGLEALAAAPLASHADLHSPPGQDPVAILEAQSADRVPELVPIRYGRMLASPFAFYRGAAALMADDLGGAPRSGLTVQLCGDAHVSNFGLFATPERRQLFDLNDFDETWPGPFEWDVKRLAASLEIAGRANGLKRKQRERVVGTALSSYRQTVHIFAGQSALEVWYARAELQPGLPELKKLLPKAAFASTEAMVAKSRSRDSLQALAKLTTTSGGGRRFISDPPLIVPLRELRPDVVEQVNDWSDRLIGSYRESLEADRRELFDSFELVDLARKAVGVGSVGTRAWVLLFLDDTGSPLILQAKEAVDSVLAPYAPGPVWENQGQRVVEGQRLMQASSDLFLGWQRTEGDGGIVRDYYVRQFRDWKGSFDVDRSDVHTLDVLASVCAWTLARAHARSGDRVAIATYLGETDEFDRAVAAFATAYADKSERDHAALLEASRSGRVEATPGL
ncbi:hypothetical protein N865_15740 [Intrasporangium oryzae NRRL B-24470]|uniref:DUF2252 domain-containing protein n=1 Tax=Intrasporangium oryzae NRRL B-24470 TaxID=1386089 RepID=W9G992_9MICO|nr:DUF2252 domain-containing protein [Intrasporangium oryzae]EWT00429.1 hypothetical protein N865_15740 [Intrasporangium oryzae NRRL B-24470]